MATKGSNNKMTTAPAKPVAKFAVPQTIVRLPDPGQVVEHVTKAPCSVEVSRNAKGQASWSIKAFSEREDLKAMADEVIDLDKHIKTRLGGAPAPSSEDGDDAGSA